MNYIEVKTSKGKGRIYKGSPKAERPVTYRYFTTVNHNIGNGYNSSVMKLFTNRAGVLKYEIYRDGNLFPYYGTFEFLI